MIIEERVPDLGHYDSAIVIEIAVEKNSLVQEGDIIITLEIEKTTVGLPASCSGRVEMLHVQLNDVVTSGQHVVTLESEGVSEAVASPEPVKETPPQDCQDEPALNPVVELSYIQAKSGERLTESWKTMPQVAQFGEADVSLLEKQRQEIKKEGVKITLLAFVIKALSQSFQLFPKFNAIFINSKTVRTLPEHHIGVAVDTSEGLVVPVIRNVEQKTVREIANAILSYKTKATTKSLSAAEMQDCSFTVSSLGGSGLSGHFTPIINLPNVAILGVSATNMKPVWCDEQWQPRLMLPLSLVYDHRAIDGKEGVLLMSQLIQALAHPENF